jgi:hypothetical protein
MRSNSTLCVGGTTGPLFGAIMSAFIDVLGTAGLAAGVATVVAAVLNNRGALRIVNVQYRLEERRKLRDLMGSYTGRMLEAAVDWDHRMRTLYAHDFFWVGMSPGLLKPSEDDGEPYTEDARWRDPDAYLYHSVVYRFLRLLAIARRFEAEAFFIDATMAREHEVDFLCYAKSFIWVMTSSKLTPNDGVPGRDHFLHEEFKPLLDLCYRDYGGDLSKSRAPKGEPIFDWRRFLTMLEVEDPESKKELDKVLSFFNELRQVEYLPEGGKRRRWERLVCLHLLALNFIETFGYAWQKEDASRRRTAALQFLIRDKTVAEAFRDGLDELGLNEQRQMQDLKSALDKLKTSPLHGALDGKWDHQYACTNEVRDNSPCRAWADTGSGGDPMYCPLLPESSFDGRGTGLGTSSTAHQHLQGHRDDAPQHSRRVTISFRRF